MPDPHDLIDQSLKILVRHAPHAFLQLAQVKADPATVSVSDAVVNVPEFRADQLVLIGREGDPDRWGWHLEFQTQPDARVMAGWQLKNSAFNVRLPIPVVLSIVYLTRGDRTTFPSSYVITGGRLTNQHSYDAIHLWEHEEAIRSGALPELAPLLVLCEEEPTEGTLQRERELLLGLETSRQQRADLLAVAVMVGTRYFARELLYRVFREEMTMLKEASFIQEWITDAETEGEARGTLTTRREDLRLLLEEKFGPLPEAVAARIAAIDDPERLRAALRQVLHVIDLDALTL